jgi:hypothetical protein
MMKKYRVLLSETYLYEFNIDAEDSKDMLKKVDEDLVCTDFTDSDYMVWMKHNKEHGITNRRKKFFETDLVEYEEITV